jgi:hypothetical protein
LTYQLRTVDQAGASCSRYDSVKNGRVFRLEHRLEPKWVVAYNPRPRFSRECRGKSFGGRVAMRNSLVGKWYTVIAMSVLGVAGCTAEANRYIRFPDFAHPGPAAVQRAQAIQHDPYPLDDVGPEIVGGRPLAYQRPVNEVERARMKWTPNGVMQPIPVPGTAVTAPPVVSSPLAVAPQQTAVPLATTPPPIVTAPYSSMPAPTAAPYLPATAPAVTSPYPAAVPQAAPFQSQQRAPY